FLRHRLAGDYEIDEFGFDAELTDTLLLPPLRQLYQKWFRVEVFGAHNLPRQGGALLVANHSGTLPLDAVMTAIAVHDNTPRRRRGDLPEDRRHHAARPPVRAALLPGHAHVPAARPARRDPAAIEVVHRVRRPDHHRGTGRRCRGRPDAGVQPDRPGPRDHPA